MPDHAEISALCRSVPEGCIMPENYASIWTGPQGVSSSMNILVVVRASRLLGVRFQGPHPTI